MADVTLDMARLEQIIRQHPARADAWLREVATEIVSDIKLSMVNTPRSGNTYRRGEGRYHTASAAGNAPAPDMGTLLNSMKFLPVGHLHYEVSDGVEYGVWLEYGTERIAARPFVRPAFDDWGRKIGRDAQERLFNL